MSHHNQDPSNLPLDQHELELLSRHRAESIDSNRSQIRSPPSIGGGSDHGSPPTQQPMLLSRDQTPADLEEAILNGESIPAFK